MDENFVIDENEYSTESHEGINIFALIRTLWDGRKTVLITFGIFIAMGILAALTMKRTYSVTTVMVPQMGSSSKSSGLGGLAALAGFDLSSSSNSSELSPLSYPKIVNSAPFRLELMHTPLHYEKCDTMISLFDYTQAGLDSPSLFSLIGKYTIGLPGIIMRAIRGEEPQQTIILDSTSNDSPKPLVVSNAEQEMMMKMSNIITFSIDKNEGFLTLTVQGIEPLQTAELAMKAQQLLQEEITRFRVEKSQGELDYIQARYDEIKQEHDRYEVMLASVTDRSQYVTTSSAGIERARIQAKYNVTNTIYNELAKQLEQSKMQVKKDTPVFAILQPVTVPTKPSNSRVITIIIWAFIGLVVGCGIVLVKKYLPKLKGKSTETTTEEE